MLAGILRRFPGFTSPRGLAIMALAVIAAVIGTIVLTRAGNPEGSALTGLQPTQVRESPPSSKVPKDIPIKHIVLIIKENRTFDNYFASYPGADGATHGMTSTGKRVPLTPAPDILEVGLGHHFTDGVKAINGGKMDGFDIIRQGKGLDAYTSFDRAGIPAYWRYADNFVLGDRMFGVIAGRRAHDHHVDLGIGGELRVIGMNAQHPKLAGQLLRSGDLPHPAGRGGAAAVGRHRGGGPDPRHVRAEAQHPRAAADELIRAALAQP